MKKIIVQITTFSLLICMFFHCGIADMIDGIISGLSVSAVESKVITSGNCGKKGDNVKFTLYDDGTLIISGEGEMMFYDPHANPSPFDLLSNKIKKVIIENNVTSVYGFAFYYCDLIETIELSDTVSEIYSSDIVDGIGLFDSKSLKNIHVSENNKTFCSIDGVLFSKEIGKTEFTVNYAINNQRKYKVYNVSENGIFLLEYPAGRTETEYVVPENVVGISSGAFRTNTHLKSILLPDDLVYIGEQAFAGCMWLESIVIPEKVDFLSNGIFAQCPFLKEIYISENIEAVCWTAFNDCQCLTDIYYGGTQDDWKKIIIAHENSALENAILHYNYAKPETQTNQTIDPDAYRLYYDKENIIPNDIVIVGADKIGGSFVGWIYDGPGEAEWEISNRDVMDFEPYYDKENDKYVNYYPHLTQIRLKIKKFGESTLTFKLNGEDVCSTRIKITLSDNTIVSRYKQHILDSRTMSVLDEGKQNCFNVIRRFSSWDQWKIAIMTCLDNHMGADAVLKWLGSTLGFTTSEYEDYMDNAVNELVAEYLSVSTADLKSINDFSQKFDYVRATINFGESYNFDMKSEIIDTLFEKTYFSRKQIENSLEIAGMFADSVIEAEKIGATTVMLAQFNMEVLQNLLETASSAHAGDLSADLCKSVKRIMKRVSDLESYTKKLLMSSIGKHVIEFSVEAWIKYKNLNAVGLVLEAGALLASWYQSDGGIMADEYMNAAVSYNNACVIYRAMENCKSAEKLQFQYGMYVTAVKVALQYSAQLAEGKKENTELKEDIVHSYRLINEVCSYEDMMDEARKSIEGTYVKTTSSGVSSKNTSYNYDEFFMTPDNISTAPYGTIRLDKENVGNVCAENEMILPGTIRSIGAYTFSEYHDMESICLDDRLEDIEEGAFYGCDGLRFITIPDRTKTIGNKAFEKCSSIRHIVLNTDFVGDRAFGECTSLSEIRFNNRNTLIGMNVFEGCRSDLTITGYRNSTAEEYAEKYHIRFEAIPEYVESLDIVTPADKTVYHVGEEIDTSGLTVRVVYKDGTSDILSGDFIVSCDMMTVGNKKAYVICGEKSVAFDISVDWGNLPEITLDDTYMQLFCGTSRQIHAETDSDMLPVIYTSSNPDIAKISTDGYVQALKAGKVQITASVADTEVSAVCEIEVSDDMEISGEQGEKYVIFSPFEDGYYSITLSSDDLEADIIICDERKNEILTDRNDNLSWTAILEYGKVYTIRITGEISPADHIRIEKYFPSGSWQITDDKGKIISEIYAEVNDSFLLHCRSTLKDDADTEYCWESDDPSVAAIDNNGNVKCLSEGTAVIRVSISHRVIKEIPVQVVNKDNAGTELFSSGAGLVPHQDTPPVIWIVMIMIAIVFWAAVAVLIFRKKNKKIGKDEQK